MKYDEQSQGWTLYWFDRNSKAHRYDLLEPDQPIERLLAEYDEDPTASSRVERLGRRNRPAQGRPCRFGAVMRHPISTSVLATLLTARPAGRLR